MTSDVNLRAELLAIADAVRFAASALSDDADDTGLALLQLEQAAEQLEQLARAQEGERDT